MMATARYDPRPDSTRTLQLFLFAAAATIWLLVIPWEFVITSLR